MKINDWLAESAKKLKAVGIETAELDCLLLLEKVTAKERAYLLANRNNIRLSPEQSSQLNQLLAKRLKRVPIDHLTGQREFYGLSLIVNRHVLSPRPETETLVDITLALAPKNANVLDMGTGSGAIAIALKTSRPGLAITAADYSKPALKIAKQNITKHNLRIKLIQSNLFSKTNGRFNVIAANLPYVPKRFTELSPETRYEPKAAIFAGNDGLDLYRSFFKKVNDYLKPAGYIIIEADPTQHNKLIEIAKNIGLYLHRQDHFCLVFSQKVPLE